jgi:hypothetical protein
MSQLTRTDPVQGAYLPPVRRDVTSHVAKELGLEERALREAVGPAEEHRAPGRPGEVARQLADQIATAVPLGIGPGIGYLPVVAPPTVDVRA